MKNSLTVFTLLLLLISSGCNTENDLATPISQDQIEPENEISEIELLEKETGITLFKKDLVLTDETGKHQVIMRVAAREKVMVESYLTAFSFSITPTFNPVTQVNEGTQQGGQEGQFSTSGESDLEGIFTEFITIELTDGATGFSTNVILMDKSLKNAPNARNGFPEQATHISGKWPEIFKCWTTNSIGYDLDRKSRWYSGWSSTTFCNYNNSSVCKAYWEQPGFTEQWTWIDGPYKVRAVVDYNNYWDYSFEFTNL